jgi:hypothetical protein
LILHAIVVTRVMWHEFYNRGQWSFPKATRA